MLLAMAAALLTAGTALADVPPSPFAQCEAAIEAAARARHIPGHLLSTIGRVESGRPDPESGAVRPWPWTIDVGGEPHVFASKEEAVAAVRALRAKGVRSVDVGCMQVNLMHHPDAFASLEQAFEPTANAAYAARFLVDLHRESGSWPVAVSWYHSQTVELAEQYQRRVFGRLVEPVPGVRAEPASAYGAWPPPGSAFAAIPPASYAYRAFANAPGSPEVQAR